MVQKRFKFPEGSVELYAEKVANRGLSAIAQAESLRYKLLGGLAVRRCVQTITFICILLLISMVFYCFSFVKLLLVLQSDVLLWQSWSSETAKCLIRLSIAKWLVHHSKMSHVKCVRPFSIEQQRVHTLGAQ